MISRYLFVITLLFTVQLVEFKSHAQENDTLTEQVLSMSLDELLSLKVITAGKQVQEVKEIPASAVIITRKDIELLGFTSYTEILEHIAGFYMIDDYYWLGSMNFGVRGFFSTGPFNNIIVLVNGISQLSDKYSDYPDVKINVPVEAIDRIEIIKGPMSVMYGSGAFFGAINIITNTVDENNPCRQVSASYGSLQTGKISARLSGAENKLKYCFNASISSTKGIDVPFTDLTSNESVLNYVGLNSTSKTAGQFDDSRKYFNLFLEHTGLFFDLSFIETKKDIFDGQPGFDDGSLMKTHASNVVLGYQKEINDKFSFKIKSGYYSHGHIIDYMVFRPYYYEVDGQTSSSFDIELNTFYKPNDKFELTAGLYDRTVLSVFQISDFAYYGLNYGHGKSGLPRGEHYSTGAAYSQIKYQPFDFVSITGGIRIEHLQNYNMYNTRGIVSEDPDDNRNIDSTGLRRIYTSNYQPANNGFSIIPTLAILFNLNSHNVVKLLYGQATKQPSFSENYRQLPENRPLLNAADIQTFELNYIMDIPSKFNLNFSLFHNELDNLISTTNLLNQLTREWEFYSTNSGKMATNGVELGLGYSPIKKLRINISGVYQHSKDKRVEYKDIDMGYSPTLLLYGNLSWQLLKKSSISLIGRYIDKMETLWKTESTTENGYRIGNTIEPQYIFDANLRISELFNTEIFFNLKVSNIFDTQIRYPTTTSNAWMDKGSLGKGRTVLFMVGYKF